MAVPLVLTEPLANLIGRFADVVEGRSCHVTSRRELVAVDAACRQEELDSIGMWISVMSINAR